MSCFPVLFHVSGVIRGVGELWPVLELVQVHVVQVLARSTTGWRGWIQTGQRGSRVQVEEIVRGLPLCSQWWGGSILCQRGNTFRKWRRVPSPGFLVSRAGVGRSTSEVGRDAHGSRMDPFVFCNKNVVFVTPPLPPLTPVGEDGVR